MKKMLKDLNRAIKNRKYGEVESIANDMLEQSPSEDADRCIHDIIGSANTIRDAEDEIRYQYDDLVSAIDETTISEKKETDGL